MNHAGEIRTLVGVAEPDVRVWTNVGDAHLGFFESADAIADAKAEILEQARAGQTCSWRTRTTRASRRAPGHSPAGVVTFGLERPADVRATSVVARGARRNRRAGEHARRGCRPADTAARGSATWPTCSPRPPWRCSSSVPLDGVASGCRNLQPARRRGELLRLPGRRHAHRRLLQLQPGGAAPGARRLWPPPPAARARSRCSARCSSSATTPRAARGVRRARPPQPGSIC